MVQGEGKKSEEVKQHLVVYIIVIQAQDNFFGQSKTKWQVTALSKNSSYCLFQNTFSFCVIWRHWSAAALLVSIETWVVVQS